MDEVLANKFWIVSEDERRDGVPGHTTWQHSSEEFFNSGENKKATNRNLYRGFMVASGESRMLEMYLIFTALFRLQLDAYLPSFLLIVESVKTNLSATFPSREMLPIPFLLIAI